MNKMGQNYKEIAAIVQKRRDDLLSAHYPLPEIKEESLPQDLRTYPKTSGLFSSVELGIIELDAETILQRIRDRKLTSVEVTKAFCKASAVAQKLVRVFRAAAGTEAGRYY
jgi:amidase